MQEHAGRGWGGSEGRTIPGKKAASLFDWRGGGGGERRIILQGNYKKRENHIAKLGQLNSTTRKLSYGIAKLVVRWF